MNVTNVNNVIEQSADPHPDGSISLQMIDEGCSVELDEIVRLECLDNTVQIVPKQLLQLAIANVTCGNQEQFIRLVLQQEHIHKILVLGDDHTLLT